MLLNNDRAAHDRRALELLAGWRQTPHTPDFVEAEVSTLISKHVVRRLYQRIRTAAGGDPFTLAKAASDHLQPADARALGWTIAGLYGRGNEEIDSAVASLFQRSGADPSTAAIPRPDGVVENLPPDMRVIVLSRALRESADRTSDVAAINQSAVEAVELGINRLANNDAPDPELLRQTLWIISANGDYLRPSTAKTIESKLHEANVTVSTMRHAESALKFIEDRARADGLNLPFDVRSTRKTLRARHELLWGQMKRSVPSRMRARRVSR